MKLSKFFTVKNQHLILFIILIVIAMVRNFESIQGLKFGYDYDSDRDLSVVQNIIEGNLYHDASYLGEYMWYNPLITFMEAGLVKFTGISPHYLVTCIGAYLNILCAISFYILLNYIFNSSIALSAGAAFLFFTTGDMLSWGAATYSPWMYPVNFMQTFFYATLLIYSIAFVKPSNVIFILAGLFTGLTFLGHSAPAVILLIIFSYFYIKKMIYHYKSKSKEKVISDINFGILFCATFIISTLPFLFIVVSKYKLHMVNTIAYEYTDSIFSIKNIPHLLKENISISFFISLTGIYFLNREYKTKLIREVLFVWLFACIFLFMYTNLVPFAHHELHIKLPGIVPSFHFFFYLKALQSVLFGIGFYHLSILIFNEFVKPENIFFKRINFQVPQFIGITIIILSFIYYPIYSQRKDFILPREYSLKKEKEVEKIEIYNWLLEKTDINDVVVCDEKMSNFPVLASGRKLVAVSATMSNPYIRYDIRNRDRKAILNYLNFGHVEKTENLLIKYSVKYIIMERANIVNKSGLENYFGKPVFENRKFSVYQHSTEVTPK